MDRNLGLGRGEVSFAGLWSREGKDRLTVHLPPPHDMHMIKSGLIRMVGPMALVGQILVTAFHRIPSQVILAIWSD